MSFTDDWQAWHEEREQRLRDPRGWLAITAIHWLGNRSERFHDVPGSWRAEGDAAEVTVEAGEEVVLDGRPLAPGTHRLGPLDEEGVTVTFGDAVAQVALRPGGPILRPRHGDSPRLRAYAGTPTYSPDPGWVVPARFEPAAEPRADGVGELVLEREGAEHRLLAWDGGAGDGRLWVLFRDATSGVTTYAANRQLDVPAPGPDGTTWIDFNRAINMPCAYTDFATCPLPPAQNTLPFAVEAGERIPRFTSG